MVVYILNACEYTGRFFNNALFPPFWGVDVKIKPTDGSLSNGTFEERARYPPWNGCGGFQGRDFLVPELTPDNTSQREIEHSLSDILFGYIDCVAFKFS